jgi:hypothetical protein
VASHDMVWLPNPKELNSPWIFPDRKKNSPQGEELPLGLSRNV